MEFLFEIAAWMAFMAVFEFARILLGSVLDAVDPSRRGSSRRWTIFGWMIGLLGGFAAGSVSLSVAPQRVAHGVIATGLVWLTLPLLGGGLALLVQAMRRAKRPELFDAFLAGVLFSLAYLFVRLAIPA